MCHSEVKHLHYIVMYMGKKTQPYALPAQLHVALQFQKVETILGTMTIFREYSQVKILNYSITFEVVLIINQNFDTVFE